MAPVTLQQLSQIAGRPANANMASVLHGLAERGDAAGLNRIHRLAHYLSQLSHESAGFQYDAEVWGPTAAQKRYDARTDLGNTAEVDGDGYLYRGRTGIQITGKANTRDFRDWCRKHFSHLKVPDFVADPDALNTDPWEGLGPLWYWESRPKLNARADAGDIEGVTKTINGGYNGLADRQTRYTRAALVLMGMEPSDVRRFQIIAALKADGIAGPATRAALHKHMLAVPAVQWSAKPFAKPSLSALFAAFLSKLFGGRNV